MYLYSTELYYLLGHIYHPVLFFIISIFIAIFIEPHRGCLYNININYSYTGRVCVVTNKNDVKNYVFQETGTHCQFLFK